MDKTLALSDVTRSYGGVRVVKGISFELRPGEICGYLGPNGSGKTTTVRMLTGLMPPDGGAICYGGREIFADLAAYKARLGYVPGRANVKLLLAVYWLLFLAFSYAGAMLERWLWFHTLTLVLVLTAGCAAVATLAFDHRRWQQSLAGCRFEDRPEPAVQTLFVRG